MHQFRGVYEVNILLHSNILYLLIYLSIYATIDDVTTVCLSIRYSDLLLEEPSQVLQQDYCL